MQKQTETSLETEKSRHEREWLQLGEVVSRATSKMQQAEIGEGIGPNGGVYGHAKNFTVFEKSLPSLMSLYGRQVEASENYSASVNDVAEKAGLLTAVVRKYVRAVASNKINEVRQEVEQLSLLFDSEG